MSSVHEHRTLTKSWLGKCLSSRHVQALRLTGAGVAWWQRRKWIGPSAYDHEAQHGDSSTPCGYFVSIRCTVHRGLIFVLTNKHTINTITVCLCNLHCYMFRHFLVISTELQQMPCEVTHIFSNFSAVFCSCKLLLIEPLYLSKALIVTPCWWQENVETCSSVDYTERLLWYVLLWYWFVFVGYNKILKSTLWNSKTQTASQQSPHSTLLIT